LVLVAACSSGGSDTTSLTSRPGEVSSTTTTSEPDDGSLTFLALGDSWPEGAHCGGCRTFVGLFADGLAALTGHHIDFVDRTGQAQPFFEAGGGSASLLRALQSDQGLRDQVTAADIIVIATGANEIVVAYEPFKAGTCGGSDNMACFGTLDALWRETFDSILSEIEQLRANEPTAIRLVGAANAFLSEPELTEGMEPEFATTSGARIFEMLRNALCSTALDHGAVCIDVRPILNGPNLDQPVDESSDASMRAVADALIAEGLPELG
jgi:hypothetical protein